MIILLELKRKTPGQESSRSQHRPEEENGKEENAGSFGLMAARSFIRDKQPCGQEGSFREVRKPEVSEKTFLVQASD